MVDLHSHVLFGIDDGAKDLNSSLAILKKAEKIGINKIMATPHFSIGDDVEEFLARRERRMHALQDAMEEEGINIRLKAGAEVYITDELFNEDRLQSLALGDSKFILAEFKYHGVKSEDMLEYVDEILENDLKILIAHPERYSHLMHNPRLVRTLIDRGVYFQLNAISLFEDSPEGDFARTLLHEGVADVIGSDIHHPSSRRLDAVDRLISSERHNLEKLLTHTPDKIFENLL